MEIFPEDQQCPAGRVTTGGLLNTEKTMSSHKYLKMKRIFFLMTIVASLFGIKGASAQNPNQSTSFYKSNMHCASCEKSLFEHLRFEKGVKDLKVDHVSNTVKVVYDKRKNSEESLAKSIVKKGYEAHRITSEEYERLTLEAGKKGSPEDHQH
jgi:copper chaperone CopZ